MNNEQEIPNVEPQMDPNANAVSLYGQNDALDEFPVLKAFQQYVDSEQAKARKRMLTLCVFFGCLMIVVIAVFLTMLMRISNRNQQLNDRLVEFAINNRDRVAAPSSPVVVQPPQDSAAILALTAKLDAMQKKLADDQAKAAKDAAEAAEKAKQAAIEAATPKPPSAAEVELELLKKQMAEEKARAAAEKRRLMAERKRQQELKHQAEIEAYRRKHYPELYQQPSDEEDEAVDEDLEDILNIKSVRDDTAVSYFDEDEKPVAKPRKKATKKAKKKSTASPAQDEEKYSIPVDIKGSSSSWNIPEE